MDGENVICDYCKTVCKELATKTGFVLVEVDPVEGWFLRVHNAGICEQARLETG